MDVGWKRAHLLLFFLTFWKHAVGQEGLAFESVDPRSLSFQKTYSPQGVQSSMLNASVTGNIPLEEVDSNVLAGNGTSPSRSRFSYLQFVKGGAPSSYASMSKAQSASSGSVSKSLTVPQNLSQPGSVSFLGTVASQSSFGQSAPGSYSALSYSPTFLSQSGSKSLNTSSQSSSGTHMGGVSSWLTSRGSSRPHLTGSSRTHVSKPGRNVGVSGLYQHSPSKSQSSPKYSSHGSLPIAVSRYPISNTSSQSLYSSVSRGSSSYQLAASRPSGLAQGSSSQPGVSYVQSQGSLSQVAIGSPQLGSASVAAPQVPQTWLPSASFSPGSQTSGTALSQSSYSPQTAPAPSRPVSSVGRPSQVAPGLLHSSASMSSPVLCQYNIAAENVNSLSQHQPLQRLQPSVSLSSPSIQTSSSVPLQSSSLFDAVKTLSSFSPSSAGGPSPLVYTPGAGSYSGSLFSPGSSMYSKLTSSPLGAPSQFPSAPSSDLPTSSLQSTVGTAQTVSSHYTSAQKGSTSTFSSSLQPQAGSSQYGPAPSLDGVLVSSQAPPAGTIYHSQPSRFWQPSISKGTDGRFSTSGAALLQSSSSSQSVQAPSSSSSAGAVSYPVSTQGSGYYSDLSHYPGTLLQYTPVAPASGLFGSSPLSVASQSASGQSSPSQYTLLSQSRTGSLLTSSGSLSAPGGSGSSGGSSLLAQGTFGKYSPAASIDTRMPVFSQTKGVSSGVSLSQSQPLQSSAIRWLDLPAYGAAALQSGSSQSPQTSGSTSFLPASSTPVDSVAQSGQTSVAQQTPSLLGLVSRPARPLSIASSGSVSNQLSPALSALLKQPTGSMTPGSTSQAALGGLSSASSQALGDTYGASVGGQGMSSGSKSVLFSSYSSLSQSGPVSYSQASGSAGSQVSPGFSASLKQPTGSMTPGSTAQGVSVSSQAQTLSDSVSSGVGVQGMSSGLKSVLHSSYGSSSQSGPVSYSQSAGGQSSPSQYTSLSQSRTGSLLTSSGYVSAPGGSGSSLLAQGTFGKYTPVASMDTRVPVFSQTKGVSSGVSLSQSQPLQSSAIRWLDVQASAAAPSESSQRAQTSSISFLPASSTPVDSVAQSGQTSVSQQTPSLLGFGSRPARLLSLASSGSVSNQMSPGLSTSFKQPTGSMSPGSAAQGLSVSSQAQTPSDSGYGADVGGQGISSVSKCMFYSSYGSSTQSGPVSYSPVSGSAGSQVSPGLFASFKQPTGSITPGSTAQPASGGISSAPSQALSDTEASGGVQGMSGSVSSGLTVSSSYVSSYDQMNPVSKPSRGSLRQYYAVKG